MIKFVCLNVGIDKIELINSKERPCTQILLFSQKKIKQVIIMKLNKFSTALVGVSLMNIPSIECKPFPLRNRQSVDESSTNSGSTTQADLLIDPIKNRFLQSNQFTINENPSVSELMDFIRGQTTAPVIFRNAVFNGDPKCAAIFTGASSVVTDPSLNFPDTGFILGTGDVNDLPSQNGTATTTVFGTPGDPDLVAEPGQLSFDACSLEFEFRCINPNADGALVSMDYVLASDEYKEQIAENTGFADNFKFLI